MCAYVCVSGGQGRVDGGGGRRARVDHRPGHAPAAADREGSWDSGDDGSGSDGDGAPQGRVSAVCQRGALDAASPCVAWALHAGRAPDSEVPLIALLLPPLPPA